MAYTIGIYLWHGEEQSSKTIPERAEPGGSSTQGVSLRRRPRSSSAGEGGEVLLEPMVSDVHKWFDELGNPAEGKRTLSGKEASNEKTTCSQVF